MAEPRTWPEGLRSLRQRFDAELSAFLKEQRDVVIGFHADLEPLVDEVGALALAGGKRLRPMFCYWGYRAAGGPDGPEIVRAALCLELLHTFALLHDDIMDGSRVRRARPSAWVRFSGLPSEGVWREGVSDFGVSAAILAGDLALMWADALLGEASFPAPRVVSAFGIFTKMRVEVTAGQYLDLLEGRRGNTDEASARRICTLKSGRYTVERPLQIGLALAGGDARLHQLFSAYGGPLGQAFQLRDDILGVFGDPTVTGKPSDDDLREGKETVLVAKARARSNETERRALDALLGSADLDASGVDQLRRILVGSGALAETEELVQALAAEAVAALSHPWVTPEIREALTELADYVARRDR